MRPKNARKPRKRANTLKTPAKWLMLVLIVTIFIFMLYPSLVVQGYQYQLGDIADRDIKAPKNFFIEDKLTTQLGRKQASEAMLTVYDHDPHILQQINDNIDRAFSDMRTVIENVKRQAKTDNVSQSNDAPQQHLVQKMLENELRAQKDVFESQLGIEISRSAYKILINERFASTIANQLIQILTQIQSKGVVANKEILLKEINKGITIRNAANQTEKTVTTLQEHHSPDQARSLVPVIAKKIVIGIHHSLVSLIIDISQKLIQPNLTLNLNETKTRRLEAETDVKPIMYRFKAGEMLVREGDRITAKQQQILETLSRQREHQHIVARGFGAALVVAVFILCVHVLYFRNSRHTAINTNKNMLFMSLVLIMVFGIAKMGVFLSIAGSVVMPLTLSPAPIVYAAPAAAGAMLVCIFLGFEIAMPFSLVASICVALLFGNRIEIFAYFLISSSMGAYWVQHCRERKAFMIAGIKTGILNILLATAASIYLADYSSLKLIIDWTMAFSSGIASAVVAVGVAPLFEMAFGYATDITLLELANLDRPILRRLMLEAPGTYHHSVIVGSLVEAAAAEIGANPLLAKVCGYYHDIGKVRKPLYFIENQTNMKNKHDKLAPSMSSLILIAHIKDGVEIAKKDKLGQAIIDTITQHHGTSLISYFFNKAKQLKGADRVKEDDYRYPGPRPQTKETGLVMLADVVDAASRTLENPTPAKIQGLVQHLINKIFSDGQLDHCELTLKDLNSIAKSFNQILNGIHHHRIEYSEKTTKEYDKGKHGHTDRQSTGKSSRRDRKNKNEGTGHLKRLGLP